MPQLAGQQRLQLFFVNVCKYILLGFVGQVHDTFITTETPNFFSLFFVFTVDF
jgi:hypothetical protein